MNIINLVSPEQSTNKITISRFPDGQVGVEVDGVESGVDYLIKSRFSSYNDLMIILATNQVLRDKKVKSVSLNIPYLLSARSDRKFKSNQSFDLKIVADIINSAKFDAVYILDPHSDVAPALLNNCVPFSAYDGFLSWIPNVTQFWEGKTLISPDAGAFKKLFKVSETLKVPMITGSKVRNGDTIETVFFGDVNGKECVIVDDICDGGRTFEQLGMKLKLSGATKVILLVTHGIFSKGLTLEHIDEIYTTNSYREFDLTGISDKFHVIDIFK